MDQLVRYGGVHTVAVWVDLWRGRCDDIQDKNRDEMEVVSEANSQVCFRSRL